MVIVKAAAVQISPVLYSREGTVQKVIQKIAELAKLGVQFATFPETVVPYYPYFSFVQTPFELRTGKEHLRLLDQAVTVPSATTQAIGEAARQARMVVSIGVNERDGGTLYNTQLLFDADGTLIQRRRKISPTFHERMIWGQGDGSGLRAVDSVVGRIGQLACWEHYNPLARYALHFDQLSPIARDAAKAAGLGAVCTNPYQSIVVRAVEVLYACDEAVRIIEDYVEPERPFVPVTPRAATGHGATEAPRGLIYHRYKIADDGSIALIARAWAIRGTR